MKDSKQPTPEQRAAWRNALTVLPDDGLGVVANEAIPALDAEVDRLTFELSAAREDHNATKTGWERAAAELHHADERVRDAERLGRALRGELDECTRERGEARAELAALRAAVQVGEGEVFVRAEVMPTDADGWVQFIGTMRKAAPNRIWLRIPNRLQNALEVERSAVVQFPPAVAPAPADRAVRWGHADQAEPEGWTGAFPIRDEAIADGHATYEGGAFWIQEGHPVDVGSMMPDADWVLEQAAERAADEVGEAAEDWPDVSDEKRAQLTTLLQRWARENAPGEFWAAFGGPERIDPPAQTKPGEGGGST